MEGKDFYTIDNAIKFMAERFTTGRTVGRVTYFDVAVVLLYTVQFLAIALILMIRFYFIKAIEVTVGKVSDRIDDWAWNSYDTLEHELVHTYYKHCIKLYDRCKDQLSDFDRNIIEISLQELSE